MKKNFPILCVVFLYILCSTTTSYAQAFTKPLWIMDTLVGPTFNLNLQAGSRQFYTGVNTGTFGYNGSFFGPTLIVNKGDYVFMNVTNNLNDTTTTHWHGLHIPALADGGPHTPINPGMTWSPAFKILDKAATYWYHPHLHMKTERQVAKGAVGLIIVRDEEEATKALPRTYGVDDFPLVIQSKIINPNNGQIALTGPWDTVMTINGVVKPYLQVPAQPVRFRMLNASSRRVYLLGMSDNRQYYQIATDGSMTPQPRQMNRLRLANGERSEIVIDFTGLKDSVYYLMCYGTELGPFIPGGGGNGGGAGANPYDSADYAMMKIQVIAPTNSPVAFDPTDTLTTITTLNEIDADTTRIIKLTGGVGVPFSFDNATFDHHVINHTIELNNTEVWELQNTTFLGHPFHIHDVQFMVLDKNGLPPPVAEQGLKDVIFVEAFSTTRFITKFTDFADAHMPYMYHCHNMAHEDGGMMGQFLVVDPHSHPSPVLDFQTSKGGTQGDFFYAVKELPNSDIVAAGYSKSNDFDATVNKGVEDGWIVKMDSAKNIIWQKSVGGTGADILYNFTVLPNGDIISCGKTFSNNGDVTGNHGSWDFWMVKLDASGTLLRSKCFGSTAMDEANSVIRTYDNNLIVTGLCGANNGDVTGFHGGADMWTLKVDTAFNIIWQSTIGGSGADKAYQVVEDRDTNYLVFGNANSVDGDIANNKGGVDYLLAKINRTGAINTIRNYGGTASDDGRSIALNADNTIIMGGSTTSTNGDITNNYGLKDAWAIKVDANYNIIWSKCYGGSLNDAGAAIQQTDEGGFIFLCETNSNDGLVNGNHGANTTDFWPIRLDSNGTHVMWKHCWGTTSNDQPWGLAITKQRGYIFCGQNYNNNGDATLHRGQGDGWIIKTTADPITPPSTFITSISSTQLCPGNTFDISYSVCGYVKHDNVFTAQLSDKNGSFAMPDTIGSLSSETNGIIACTVPIDASGLSYRVRVVASQNCFANPSDSLIKVSCFAPINQVSNTITSASAKLNWTNNSDCKVSTQIKYRKVGDSTWLTTNSTSSSKTILNLSSSTKYQWKVRTKCNASPLGFSTFSTTKTFTTLGPRQFDSDVIEDEKTEILNIAPKIFLINFINIKESKNIDVFDVNGRIAMQKKADENSIQLDLSILKNGLYLIRCYSSCYSYSGKIFIN